MISVNKVVGTFENIQAEMVIDIPNGEKVVFVVDNAALLISINDNQHYMEYRQLDEVIEFYNDANNYIAISKMYVKAKYAGTPSKIRVWVMV